MHTKSPASQVYVKAQKVCLNMLWVPVDNFFVLRICFCGWEVEDLNTNFWFLTPSNS